MHQVHVWLGAGLRTQAIRIQNENGPHLDTFRLDPCPQHYIAMWMYWMYWFFFWLHNLTISVCSVITVISMFYIYIHVYSVFCQCIYYLQPCIKAFQFLNYSWVTIFGNAKLDFARLSRGVQRGCSHCQTYWSHQLQVYSCNLVEITN